MAYFNPYFPNGTGSNPYYTGPNSNYSLPVNSPPSQTSQSISVVPVQGLDAAKSYPVGAGNTVVLMDYSNGKFWVKSTGMDGLTQSMTAYLFYPESEEKAERPIYATKEEFEALKKQFEEFIK